MGCPYSYPTEHKKKKDEIKVDDINMKLNVNGTVRHRNKIKPNKTKANKT